MDVEKKTRGRKKTKDPREQQDQETKSKKVGVKDQAQ
jgi:hypothetical protein